MNFRVQFELRATRTQDCKDKDTAVELAMEDLAECLELNGFNSQIKGTAVEQVGPQPKWKPAMRSELPALKEQAIKRAADLLLPILHGDADAVNRIIEKLEKQSDVFDPVLLDCYGERNPISERRLLLETALSILSNK